MIGFATGRYSSPHPGSTAVIEAANSNKPSLRKDFIHTPKLDFRAVARCSRNPTLYKGASAPRRVANKIVQTRERAGGSAAGEMSGETRARASTEARPPRATLETSIASLNREY